MRFVRYGVLKPIKQERYCPDPGEDCYVHTPPTRSGFYAFPQGFVDMFYVPYGYTDGNQRLIRPKDENGKMIPWEAFLKPNIQGRSRYDECPTELGRKILKRYGASRDQVRDVEGRTSYVRLMADPLCPPKLLASGRLDQFLPILRDKQGEPIDADAMFRSRKWMIDDYRWAEKKLPWKYVQREDVDFDQATELLDESLIKNLDVRRLCAWPAHESVGRVVGIMKRPHVFEYSGYVWHHLGKYLRAGELMGVYQNIWFRSDVRSFEKALRRYLGVECHNNGRELAASFRKSCWRRVEDLRKVPVKNVRGPQYDSFGALECYIDGDDFRMANRRHGKGRGKLPEIS